MPCRPWKHSLLNRTACWLSTIILLSLQPAPLSAQYDGAAGVPDVYLEGFSSIDEQDSREWLSVLAGDEFAGRGTGQEGYLKAAQWFASQLEQFGFQPAAADGSWFQNVPFIRVSMVADRSGLTVAGDNVVAGTTMGISQFVGEFQQSLPVTFALVTGDRPEISESQFDGQLLVVRSAGPFRATDPLILQGRPACVLIVTDDSRIRSESVSRLEESPVATPVAQITPATAARLATTCGVSEHLFSGNPPAENLIVSSSRSVDCRLAVERESIDVPNVVGWYPGTDPDVHHEHIAIGAHLDHLGIQEQGVFPGADDNGSGSTAILQIAKALHFSPEKPRRSVLLLAFCAEERGLLGSRYYCEHPVRPLADMICMLNIDMIGRNEESEHESAAENENTIHLVGSKRLSNQLHETVLEANRYVNFEFEYDEEKVFNRSDQASFAAKGIPVTFLFGGFNPHYHKTTDNLDGINFTKIANAARLNFLTLMMAAELGHFPRDLNNQEASTP